MHVLTGVIKLITTCITVITYGCTHKRYTQKALTGFWKISVPETRGPQVLTFNWHSVTRVKHDGFDG